MKLFACLLSLISLNFIAPEQNDKLPDTSVCGITSESDRIYGGQKTKINEFPWMALLRYKDADGNDGGFRCAGTLINRRYILTAAHCVRNQLLDSIRLGEWDLTTDPDCEHDEANSYCSDPVMDVKIEEVIAHPFYSIKNKDNDIALIRLANNIDYSDYIRPICMPPSNWPSPILGKYLTVSGWGRTENNTGSDVKLKVDVPVVPNNVCQSVLSKKTRVSPNQVCAGGEKDKDACQGDSGGPLMGTFENATEEEVHWYQEGVVSLGKGCGADKVPAIYTRVTRYINWMMNNLEK